MLLKRLLIKSHRGIQELSFDELGETSVILGSNNSGKSSILEAVSLLLRPLDPSQWVQLARQRDSDIELASALWSIFRFKGILQLDDGPQQSEPLEIEGVLGAERRTLAARALASEDWNSEESEAATVRIETTTNGSNQHALVFRQGERAQWGQGVEHFRCFTITPVTHRSSKTLVEHLSRVVDEGEKSLALDMLQLFDPDIESLDVSAGLRRQTVVVKHRERGTVDLASFGDGLRRVTALALALSRAQQGVLLIDELESGIHPTVLSDVVQKLLLAAARAEVQIIATTHSLEALDAVLQGSGRLAEAEEEVRGNLVGYHLRQDGEARTVRRYSEERLRFLRQGGVDLR